MQRSKPVSGANLLIALAWLVYTISYLGKVNYSANIVQIVDYYGVTKAEAGMAPTFFFFAYGIGQVVNGLLCKKYNVKWMIFAGLFTSACINLTIALTTNFAIIKWLWMCNGFCLSILWPTLVRMLSESLPTVELGKSSLVMGTTVGSGTLVIYGLSSLFAALDNFKLAFYTAAFAGIAVSLIWLLLFGHYSALSKRGMTLSETSPTASDVKSTTQISIPKIAVLLPAGVLSFAAVGSNLIKDGLTTWGPSILNEEGSLSASISILLTLFLPVVTIIGNVSALGAHKKIPDYIVHCLVFFATMIPLIGLALRSISLRDVALMLIAMIVVSFLASNLNSLITSVFPMFMRQYVNSGLYAGVLNGFAYLGSTISSYGLGVIADNFGWTAVFWSLLAVCVLTCVVCSVTAVINRRYVASLQEVQ